MAKRTSTKSVSSTAEEMASATADTIEQQVIAFAEQVGRIVGTVQARAEGLDRKMLTEQIARVRDSATHLLDRLQGYGAKPKAAQKARGPDPNGRSGGLVDAPGKRHRKPMPSVKGAKTENRIAKMRTVNARRRQRPGQA